MFLSVCRPPPCPPLFPYTTLFRSLVGHLVQVHADLRQQLQLALGDVHVLVEAAADLAVLAEGRKRRGRNGVDRVRDRKSTRLNSSHRCISYAVFCLKKKTIKPN